VDMICGIEPSCVIVPDRVEIETFNNWIFWLKIDPLFWKLLTHL
jgi:hypothetical protein